MRESLNYAPASARYKIYIVDEVHMLTKEAFNAFLKTLEEPPPYVKFIFATTDLHKVPITIQSRCQRYDFRLLDRAEIVEQLRRIVEAEGIAMSPAALGAVAGAGEGSMRDAESLLEQVVAYCGRTVRDEEVAAALGLPEEKTLLAFCADLLGRRGAACLATLDAVAALGMDARVFAREVLGMLRNLAVLRAAPEATDLVPVTPETLAELQPLAAAASPGHLQSLFEIFLRVETEVRNATFPRMLLELAVLRAVRLEEVQEIATLLERLEQFERRLAAGGWSAPAPGSAEPRSGDATPAGLVRERPVGGVARCPVGSGAAAEPRARPLAARAARSIRRAATRRCRRRRRFLCPVRRAGAAREGDARRVSRARAAAQGRGRGARDRLRVAGQLLSGDGARSAEHHLPAGGGPRAARRAHRGPPRDDRRGRRRSRPRPPTRPARPTCTASTATRRSTPRRSAGRRRSSRRRSSK